MRLSPSISHNIQITATELNIMNCSQCNRMDETLIEVFNLHSTSPQMVCQSCIIGKDVPVYRQSLSRLQFGEVQQFDRGSSQHYIQFPDDTFEWASIDSTPLTSYISFQKSHSTKPLEKCKQSIDLCALSLSNDAHGIDKSCLVSNQTTDLTAPTIDTTDNNHSIFRRVEPAPNTYHAPAHTSQLQAQNPLWSSNPPEHHYERDVIPWCGAPGGTDRQFTAPFSHAAYGTNAKPSSFSRWDHTSSKPGPKMWTFEEDCLLLRAIESSGHQVKWPLVARLVKGRTSKQCRERYVNQLNKKLKVDDWSPEEDIRIFHMYAVHGSKWAMMSKLIKGRTDNNIKNRFHHIRRRLEKDHPKLLKSYKTETLKRMLHMKRFQSSPRTEDAQKDMSHKIQEMLPHLAVSGLNEGSEPANARQFGPFRPANGEGCARCHLIAPSVHTGRTLCKTTGWCESCTRLPAYLSRHMLRECLNLRRAKDTNMEKDIEVLEATVTIDMTV